MTCKFTKQHTLTGNQINLSAYLLIQKRKQHSKHFIFMPTGGAVTIDWLATDHLRLIIDLHLLISIQLAFDLHALQLCVQSIYSIQCTNRKIDQLSITVINYWFTFINNCFYDIQQSHRQKEKKEKNFISGWDRTITLRIKPSRTNQPTNLRTNQR